MKKYLVDICFGVLMTVAFATIIGAAAGIL